MINIKNTQPKLRFNGIKCEIAYLKLKSFSVVKCGKTPSTKNELFWLNGTIPFVTPTDIINAGINKTERFVTTEGLKKSQKAITGSVFVTCVASIGKNSMCDADSAFNQQINNIYSNIYNNKYLYYLMNKNEQLIKSKASKSATQIIKKSDFENIEFYLTTNIKEQTKIANFFTLLDKQIQLMERKLELYELRMKYYLNNMFCDDDFNLSKLRFEGFEEKIKNDKIQNIVSWIRSGGTPKSDNPEFYLGEIPFISIPDMKNKYLIESKKHISKLGLNNSSSYLITKNSILLSAYATIGEICINKIDVALPQSILGIKPNDNIDLEYLYYLMQSAKSKFIKLQQIGSQPNISLDIVKNVKLSFVSSFEEQTKIANLFSSLDESIQNLKKQKDQLTKRKTYYLNNMFI